MIDSGTVVSEVGSSAAVPPYAFKRMGKYGEDFHSDATAGKRYTAFTSVYGTAVDIVPGSTTAYTPTIASAVIANKAGASSGRRVTPKIVRFTFSSLGFFISGMNVGVIVDAASRVNGLTGDQSNAMDSGDMHRTAFGSTIGAPFLGARTVAAAVSPRQIGHAYIDIAASASETFELLLAFGDVGQEGSSSSTVTPYQYVKSFAPIDLAPGGAMFVHIWDPSMTITASRGESEVAWEET